MLKISLVESSRQGIILRLEGQLIGPWVRELRKTCEESLHNGRQLILDLSEVSFVDGEGIALLHSLMASRVVLRNCSPFVTEQLKGGAV